MASSHLADIILPSRELGLESTTLSLILKRMKYALCRRLCYSYAVANKYKDYALHERLSRYFVVILTPRLRITRKGLHLLIVVLVKWLTNVLSSFEHHPFFSLRLYPPILQSMSIRRFRRAAFYFAYKYIIICSIDM